LAPPPRPVVPCRVAPGSSPPRTVVRRHRDPSPLQRRRRGLSSSSRPPAPRHSTIRPGGMYNILTSE
uniref:Uncharacterized protein n=1 Tax=Aegilops tauschii subsp. strangulata TaxID=200361 RepID=A0A452Z2D8_AEGTS